MARPRLARHPVRTVRGASGQAALRLWCVRHAGGWRAYKYPGRACQHRQTLWKTPARTSGGPHVQYSTARTYSTEAQGCTCQHGWLLWTTPAKLPYASGTYSTRSPYAQYGGSGAYMSAHVKAVEDSGGLPVEVRGACTVKGGGIGSFGGGSLEHPRQWLGAQWPGLFLGVPSCSEPPGAP